jgi:hypothetical protein
MLSTGISGIEHRDIRYNFFITNLVHNQSPRYQVSYCSEGWVLSIGISGIEHRDIRY